MSRVAGHSGVNSVFRAATRLARLTSLLVVALIATACSVAVGGAPSGSPSAKPVDPDQVVFRVSWDGGFVTPESLLARLPVIVVYADGRVITQGPQIDIYPGPILPNLQEHTLSADALARLIQLARDKGLLQTIHYGMPGIADVPDTVLEINVDGQSYRISASALGHDAPGAGDVDAEGRATLQGFIDALTGVPATDFVDEEHPFEVTGLRVYAGKAVVVPDSEFPGEQAPIDWPLADLATAGLPVANSPLDVRCQVIDGDDLAKALPLLEAANTLSTFRSNGELYTFTVRPLLPGETGC
jgi:hypothetical protein